jgi:aminoglycoside phosphotransferase (APT) family kinase protein
MISRIRFFIATIQTLTYAEELDKAAYVLAHTELHFSNVMCDRAHPDFPITAMLDWEFSGVAPAPRWDPPRALLWNIKIYPKGKAE